MTALPSTAAVPSSFPKITEVSYNQLIPKTSGSVSLILNSTDKIFYTKPTASKKYEKNELFNYYNLINSIKLSDNLDNIIGLEENYLFSDEIEKRDRRNWTSEQRKNYDKDFMSYEKLIKAKKQEILQHNILVAQTYEDTVSMTLWRLLASILAIESETYPDAGYRDYLILQKVGAYEGGNPKFDSFIKPDNNPVYYFDYLLNLIFNKGFVQIFCNLLRFDTQFILSLRSYSTFLKSFESGQIQDLLMTHSENLRAKGGYHLAVPYEEMIHKIQSDINEYSNSGHESVEAMTVLPYRYRKTDFYSVPISTINYNNYNDYNPNNPLQLELQKLLVNNNEKLKFSKSQNNSRKAQITDSSKNQIDNEIYQEYNKKTVNETIKVHCLVCQKHLNGLMFVCGYCGGYSHLGCQKKYGCFNCSSVSGLTREVI